MPADTDVKPAPSGEPRDATWTRETDNSDSGREKVTPVIELRGISKRFGPVEVLSNVDLRLYAGRVHSLAGENQSRARWKKGELPF